MDVCNEQNWLIGTANASTRETLLKFAIKAAFRDYYIIYLTKTPFEHIPDELYPPKELSHHQHDTFTNNIIFMYPQSYTELLHRICSLHKWLKPPAIIIIDSLHAFGAPLVHPTGTDAQQIALLIATLFDLAATFRQWSDSKRCLTLLSVNRESFQSDVFHKMVQMYYYSNKCLTTEGDDLLDELNCSLFK